jgi:hypothetical protein
LKKVPVTWLTMDGMPPEGREKQAAAHGLDPRGYRFSLIAAPTRWKRSTPSCGASGKAFLSGPIAFFDRTGTEVMVRAWRLLQ